MRNYFSILIIAAFTFAFLQGCKNNEDLAPAAEGIIFSPLADYKEAYPGSMVSFQYKVKSSEPVIHVKLQFQLMESAGFTDLKEYPELSGDSAAATATFQNFEFYLPPSSEKIKKEIKFKFIATTSSKTFERIYTVKMVDAGQQVLRLYNPLAATYFRSQSLDLLNGRIVPDYFAADTKDMVSAMGTTTIVGNGAVFSTLVGFMSGNGTRFKLKTKAIFDDPTKYAANYVAGEVLTGASKVTLKINTYYLAEVIRPSGHSYVGIWIKKLPSAGYILATKSQDLKNEYLEIQINK